ncbi:uncharacterized protein LOC141503206 [Macrotis lagotis]|uniref:uncharacterized protein LOC141503206 n=1 Tax=Macrotis lagotis TaxID=92651 RepID=UPI003D694201
MEQENISDDSDSDSDSEIQPGTPPERYPLARPSRASTSGEAGDSQAIQDPEVDSTDQGPYFIGRTQPIRNKSLCKHGSSKVQPSPKAFDYSLDAQPTCSYVYDSEDSDSSPPTEKSIFEYSTVRIQSMSEVSLSDFLMDDDDTHDDIPTPNDMSEVSESCSSMGKPLSRSKYLKLNNKEKSNDVSSTQEDMTIWDKLHFYYGNPCDFLFEKESGGRSSPLYEILDSDLSSVEDLDSEFSYSEIMTPQSDFLSEDQSTSDSSQGPNAALSGSPSEDEEKSVSEFSSPQDQKSPCKSSIQERLFYESHLSHDQKELILEFSSSAEKPVARSCMSQVHYISGEQSMPEWEPLCFQDLKNEVLEFSSSQMPKKPVTETVPSQDPDDDDDDDSDGDHDQDNDNHDQDDDKQGTDDDEDDQDDNDNANDSATSENKDDEDTNEEDSQEEDANL